MIHYILKHGRNVHICLYYLHVYCKERPKLIKIVTYVGGKEQAMRERI